MPKDESKNNLKDDKKESTFHGQAVSTTGFLGGITFAAMVLLMEKGKEINNFEWLITGTAIISVLFIISALGMMRIAAGITKIDTTFSKAMTCFAGAGFIGLMIMLPFMVLQFSLAGAIAIGVIEAIVAGVFLKYVQQ